MDKKSRPDFDQYDAFLRSEEQEKRRKQPQPKSGRSVIELKKILDEKTAKEKGEENSK